MTSTPSWAAGEPAGVAAPRERVPFTLAVACVLAVAEAVVETVHIAGRDDLLPGMRVFLCLFLVGKLALVRSALRRSAAGAMGLFLYEATALLAAAVGGAGVAARVALAACATAVIALLASSLHAFPSPELPAADR